MSDEELRGWEYVCTEGELLPGEKITIWHDDTPILVVNLDGEYYAVEDKCSHEDFELSSGPVDAATGQIECVLHGARFCLKSGEALSPPAYSPVAKFPVKRLNGAIWTRDDR